MTRTLSPDDPVLATALARQLRSRRFHVWTGLTVVLTIALVRLPLFGVLGYELALAVALFGSLAGLDLGAAMVRAAQATPLVGLARADGRARLVAGLAVRALALPLALIALPLIAAAIHGLWAPTCDWGFGVEAFASMAVASTALGAASGVAVALWLGPVRGLAAAAPWLVAIGLIVVGAIRFYGAPAVFWYSPLVGYFPGNLYDEDLRLAGALYWSRLEQLATVLALLAGAAALLDAPSLRVRLRERRPRPVGRGSAAIAAVAALVALGLYYQSGTLGYRVDAEDVQAELGGVVRTPHFTIHYADHAAVRAEMELYAADHELRLAQVCREVGLDCSRLHIRSYVFASAEQKGRLMGARRVEMAKPWRKEIYLTFEPFPHGALRHEIAHVVAGEFGSAGFAVSARSVAGLPLLFNPGMIEGLAVALDWPGRSRSMTPHQAMKAMDELGMAPRADDVLSVRFLTLASSRGYTAAGSFLRYLLDTHGPAAVRTLYATGGDFDAALGRSQAALVSEWRQMLATIEVPAAVREAAREQYRRGGVFSRPCPHAIADRTRRAGALLASGRRDQAIAVMRTVCRDAPEEPSHRLELAELLGEGDERQQAEARATYDGVAGGDLGAVLKAEALAGLIRLEGRAGDLDGVRRHVGVALALPLDDDRRRPFEAMQFALDAGGLGGAALRAYFFSAGRASDVAAWAAVAAITGDRAVRGLGWYLVGLRADDRDDHALASLALAIGLDTGVPTDRFVRAGARRLVVAAWRSQQPTRVAQAIALLEASSYEVDRLLAADWRERVAHAASR